MKKSVLIYLVLGLMFVFCLAGCNNISESKSENNVIESDINETGSFESMRHGIPGYYYVTTYSKTTGHPSGDSMFSTYMNWKDDDYHGDCSIDYYSNIGAIEEVYPDYDDLEEYTILDKTYKLKYEEEKIVLLYKVDDSFYITIDLWHPSEFGTDGMTKEITHTPEFLLRNGYFDDAIRMDIEPYK